MSNQPRIPDMVGQYAHLDFTADRFRAAGKPVPLELTRAMQSLEARARAALPPEAFPHLVRHVEAAKAQLYQQSETQSRAREAQQSVAMREGGARMLTKNLGLLGQKDGLSYEQFEDLKSGKKVSVGNGPRPSQEVIDKDVRTRTARVDPSGKGWTQAEWTRRLDELADASEQQFTVLAQRYKASPQELRQVTDNWRQNRDEHKLNTRLHERDDADEQGRVASNAARGNAKITEKPKATDNKVEPSERDTMTAQLLDAMVTSTDWKDRRNTDFIDDGVSKDLQEEDSTRGDIARAWVTAEATEVANG